MARRRSRRRRSRRRRTRRRKSRKGKKGGSIMGALRSALLPFILYKSQKHQSKRVTRRRKRR
jgi:hypothetical protein